MKIVLMVAGVFFGIYTLLNVISIISAGIGFGGWFSSMTTSLFINLILASIFLFFSIKWGKQQQRQVMSITFIICAVIILSIVGLQIYNLSLTFPETPQYMLEKLAARRSYIRNEPVILVEYPDIDIDLVRQYRVQTTILIIGYTTSAAMLLFTSIKWLKMAQHPS